MEILAEDYWPLLSVEAWENTNIKGSKNVFVFFRKEVKGNE